MSQDTDSQGKLHEVHIILLLKTFVLRNQSKNEIILDKVFSSFTSIFRIFDTSVRTKPAYGVILSLVVLPSSRFMDKNTKLQTNRVKPKGADYQVLFHYIFA